MRRTALRWLGLPSNSRLDYEHTERKQTQIGAFFACGQPPEQRIDGSISVAMKNKLSVRLFSLG